MPRYKTPTLTDAELRLMEVVWELGEATVHDVLERLPAARRPAYNTVLTTLRILETKGYLSHSKEGRAHLYRPLSTRKQARRQALRHMVNSFFGNSPALLLRALLEEETLEPEEVAELKRMVRDADRDRRPSSGGGPDAA